MIATEWAYLIAGAFAGAAVGVLVMALLFSGRSREGGR